MKYLNINLISVVLLWIILNGCSIKSSNGNEQKESAKGIRLIMAINPYDCSTCSEKAGLIAKQLTNNLPIEYVFKKMDTSEIQYYINSVVQYKEPYIANDELFSKFSDNYSGNTTIDLIDGNGTILYSHEVKTLTEEDINTKLISAASHLK